MDVPAELEPVLAELRDREPVFHREEQRMSDADLEAAVAPDFWEIGASGRVYDRAQAMAIIRERYAERLDDDQWTTNDFHIRQVGPGTYLFTYRLDMPDRVTRRLTVWQRREDGGWRILYHQGTSVS